ncbi:hypothetical protein BWQ96_00497 [Gracilariopsis chorda]|uniref:Uncharacterized protein n=1 Tax=Gracilariopsis chorda TaxID=448386 RepID=A0A2V3J5E9_9FLOR|nr:hypothetical protein BWQ96_00497 [Gracilariopsis chorda]|eukprot:PXF49619.1 hypothetical protein BWQ96_00497 [Gracilariopsis chorda]
MKSIVSCVVLVLLLFTSGEATDGCERPLVPFDRELIGKSYGRAATCGPARFNAYSSVRIYQSNITFSPLDEDFNHGGEPRGYVCGKRLTYFYQRARPPLLQILPRVVIPPELGRDLSYCGPAQARGAIWATPMGRNREAFINAVNETVREVALIRDYGCEVPPGSFLPVRVNNFRNVKANAVITYLLGIAYQYNFCI